MCIRDSYYRTLSGDREQVELHYKSELNDRPFDELLLAARQKDLANEFTTAGIHRDDLVLKIGGYQMCIRDSVNPKQLNYEGKGNSPDPFKKVQAANRAAIIQ